MRNPYENFMAMPKPNKDLFFMSPTQNPQTLDQIRYYGVKDNLMRHSPQGGFYSRLPGEIYYKSQAVYDQELAKKTPENVKISGGKVPTLAEANKNYVITDDSEENFLPIPKKKVKLPKITEKYMLSE